MKQLFVVFLLFPTLFASTSPAAKPDEPTLLIQTKEKKDRGWLGVSTQNMTRRLAKSMDVKTEEGALVNEVIEDSPAEAAGIKEEDVIVEFKGKKIRNARDLVDAVRETKPDTKVSIIVMRRNERTTLQATLGTVPRARAFAFSVPHPRMHMFTPERGIAGMDLLELNEQLGEYFDAPGKKGVLVKEVEKKSKAAQAGFKAGDIIVRIGKQTIEDLSDVSHALAKYEEGEQAEVEIVRKGARKVLTLEIESRHDERMFFFDRRPRSGRFDFNFDDLQLEELEGLKGSSDAGLKPRMNELKLNLKKMQKGLHEQMQKLRLEMQNLRRDV
jgi:S1-C subfamily serine protease